MPAPINNPMNYLFWNVRGIANNISRVALKKLILKNSLDFVFIAESQINFDLFPKTWLSRLNIKLNSRFNQLPNLWCLCIKSLIYTGGMSLARHSTLLRILASPKPILHLYILESLFLWEGLKLVIFIVLQIT